MKTFFFALAVAMGLTSCNPLQKVLRDPAKLDAAGRQWEKSHPCVVDSVTTFLPGKTTVIFDSSAYFAYVDSISALPPIELDPNCAKYQRLIDSLSRRKPLVISTVKTIHDTMEVSKRDMRHEKILSDSVDYYTGQNQVLKGQVAQVQQSLKDKDKELTHQKVKFVLWISLLLILLIGSHILRSYLKLPFL